MADYNTVKANVAKQTAKNQTYGKAKEQMAAQQLVPMGPSPTTVNPAQPVVKKESPGLFFRPTERPNEPITAGMDFGPGVSSVGAGVPRQYTNDIAMMEIKEILKYFPNDDLFDLVSRYGGG